MEADFDLAGAVVVEFGGAVSIRSLSISPILRLQTSDARNPAP